MTPSEFVLVSSALDACTASAIGDLDDFCEVCGYPRPGERAIDIRIQERNPFCRTTDVVAYAFGARLWIVRAALLNSLSPLLLETPFGVGKVFGENDQSIEGCNTLRISAEVVVRGTGGIKLNNFKPKARQCDGCGRIHYTSLNSEFLYPDPGAQNIYSSSLGFVVRRSLWESLKDPGWTGLFEEPLVVLERSIDGYEGPLYSVMAPGALVRSVDGMS